MLPSRWWHRPLLTSVALARRPTGNWHPLWRSQNPGLRLDCGDREGHVGRIKGAATLQRVAASLDQHCATAREPPRVCDFSSGKKSPRWTSSFPSVMGHFPGSLPGSYLTGFAGKICRTQPLGDTRDGEVGWGSQQPALRSWQTTLLLTVMPEQRCQPLALSNCRTRLVALSGQGAQLAALPDLGL